YDVAHALHQALDHGRDAARVGRAAQDDAVGREHTLQDVIQVVALDAMAGPVAFAAAFAPGYPGLGDVEYATIRSLIGRALDARFHQLQRNAVLSARAAGEAYDFHN